MRKIFILFILAAALAAMGSAIFADASALEVGDRITVAVPGDEDFSKVYELDAQGNILMPRGVGLVNLLGKNTSEASEIICEIMKKYLVNPTAVVTFMERAKMRIFMVGEVKKTGLLEIGKGDRVVQALASAGYGESADLSKVTVQRGDQVINIDLTKYISGEDLLCNIELQSNDTVVVPKMYDFGSIMILGQVNKVGEISLKAETITFREVMGLIGGVTLEADTGAITVKRGETEETINVNYKAAMEDDPAANILLSDGDTIFVPQQETYFVTVIGAVPKSGQFPMKTRLTLSEGIGLAGGITKETAKISEVRITHNNSDGTLGETNVYDVAKILEGEADDPLLTRGDLIYIPHKKKTVLQTFTGVLSAISPLRWFRNW